MKLKPYPPFLRMLAVAFVLTACGAPPPRFGIGHCTPAQVELQRAEMTAHVVPALLACVQAGNAEDCPDADSATLRWLEERAACR